MKSHHNRPPETWFGAGVAFIAFLLTGAVPALVYGGYMGLMTANVLFGHPADPQLVTRLMAGGGMALGFVATLFLYLVLGAALGTGVGALVRGVTRAPEEKEAAKPHRVSH